ncbi:hypothetical protein ACWDSJ_28150 [Nocardia sp. NPDC003482]
MTTHTPATPAPARGHLREFLSAYRADPRHRGAPPRPDLADAAAAMTVFTEPFTYGVIDDFLPPALFAAVLAAWPPPQELAAVTLPSTDRYVGSRRTRLLEGLTEPDDRDLTGPPWDEVRATLRSPDLLEALAWRFPEVLDANLAHQHTPTQGAGYKVWLNQDHGAGEALGAHVDDLRKIVTIVVYLQLSGDVDASSPRRWGTALYDNRAAAVTPLEFSANADHTPAALVEFAPNRAFVMPNTATALHGVAGGQAAVTRTTLMCGYWKV